MGVKGLIGYVSDPKKQDKARPFPLKSAVKYSADNKCPCIFVDSANVIFQIASSVGHNCGGRNVLLYEEYRKFLRCLQTCAMNVTVVFGHTSVADNHFKDNTKEQRRIEAMLPHKNWIRKPPEIPLCDYAEWRKNQPGVARLGMFNATFSPMQSDMFHMAARELKIAILHCDEDDDQSMAFLAKKHGGYVISGDSDMCIFDIPGVILLHGILTPLQAITLSHQNLPP